MRCAIAAAHLSNEPNIVNARDRAVPVIFAAGEGDLELARPVMKLRMPEQITRHAEGVGRHVKHFARANSCQRAPCDIAHRIAAGFARREARLSEQPHYRGNVLELHEVKLHVLARGDVATAGRVRIPNLGEGTELRRCQNPRRNFDAEHLHARLPLAIGAMLQAEGAELVFGNGAAAKLLDALLEYADLRLDCLGTVSGFHIGLYGWRRNAHFWLLKAKKRATARFASGEWPFRVKCRL